MENVFINGPTPSPSLNQGGVRVLCYIVKFSNKIKFHATPCQKRFTPQHKGREPFSPSASPRGENQKKLKLKIILMLLLIKLRQQ